MPLVKSTLQSQVKGLLSDMRQREEVSDDEFASRLADMIDTYIKSATVTVNAGIQVSTSAGAGATTSPGTGSLS